MTQHHGGASLDVNAADRIAALAKSVLGAIPIAGPMLVELVGSIIPNQRLDRIADFAKQLECRIGSIDPERLRSQLKDPNFTELLEEGIRQSTRAVTEERRQYIASLIARSMTKDDVEYREARYLLRILDELGDLEIIWLRYFAYPKEGEDLEFRETHKNILRPITPLIGVSTSATNKSIMQHSYKEHLALLGLLEKQFKTETHANQMVIDPHSRALMVTGHYITSLGCLLLSEIGLLTLDQGG